MSGSARFAMASLALIFTCAGGSAQEAPELILYNADILTMDSDTPSASAVAIAAGRILAVGADQEILSLAGPDTSRRDLSGATIAPGFIDAHGHFSMLAQSASMANLQSPPAGGVNSIAGLAATLAEWHEAHPQAPWIMGWGYDDSLLAEQRHPTRTDLDTVSDEIPVFLIHASAHLAVCNSPCLALLGITDQTQDPEGGVIRREADGRTPNGVLEEKAMYPAFLNMPQPVESQRLAGLAAIQEVYARNGITTVQEGAASAQQISDLRKVAASGDLYLDVVAYEMVQDGSPIRSDLAPSPTYQNHFRTGGIKLVLDGSPQGKTAWFTQPYYIPPAGQSDRYSGYPIYSDEGLKAVTKSAFSQGIQIIAHANGDRAIDQYLDAMLPAIADHPEKGLRPVLIHAQTARRDQLEKIAGTGIIPSFFAAHPFFWGDWHRDSVMGPQRAAFISPLGAAAGLSIPYTIHNDSPVVPPDMVRLLWIAVNRQTRSGAVLGPEQRADPGDALRAITINAALQYGEEDMKGSVAPGKLADLVVLSSNPLSIAPEEMLSLTVIETFKEGVSIYRAQEEEG